MTNGYAVAQDRIRKVFNLSKAELAKACKVPEADLTRWRKIEPSMDEGIRLWALAWVAGAWDLAGFKYLNSETSKLPLYDGDTIFDVLCKDEVDSELILFLGRALELESWETTNND